MRINFCNKFITFFILLFLFILNLFSSETLAKNVSVKAKNKEVSNLIVCFTPGQNCTQLIVDELNKAKIEILVQAYSFTSKPIAEALVEAFKRGVDVQIILDRSQKTAKYSSIKFFEKSNIPLLIDSKHAIAHSKIMIIDKEIILSGSFNFTKAAQEKNSENLLIIKNVRLVGKYKKNWKYHLGHSKSDLISYPSDQNF